jgi:N-acetylglucosamine kinase-like BadF-type ATPase
VNRVLGLDIGGSTTRARLVADGALEAEATAASASMTAAGPQRASAALADLLGQLPELTGRLDAVCAGAAGARTGPETAEFLHATLAPLTRGGRVLVVDDASLILPAAGLTDGVAVIGGTGSIAVGSWQGRTGWAGGWGYLLGDEGSGYWLVRGAIRALLARRASGEAAGELGRSLLAAAGAGGLDELRAAFYREPAPRRWARLAPAVLDCADPEAGRLTAGAAAALADLAGQLAGRLGAGGEVPVVLAGGLMRHDRLGAATVAAVTAALPGARVRTLDVPPVAGAVRLALAAVAPG